MEAGGEVADIAICCIQNWLAYDNLSIDESVARANMIMEKLDTRPIYKFNTDELIFNLEHHAKETYFDSKKEPVLKPEIEPIWAEYYLGLAYLISKKIGIDIWEAVTLKVFANEQHYPAELRLDEKVPWMVWNSETSEYFPMEVPGDRLMNEARSPAWVFAKELRKAVSPGKRYIPPMSNPIIGETVLDKLYGSPYLDRNLHLAELAQAAQNENRPYIIPAALAIADTAQNVGDAQYYVR